MLAEWRCRLALFDKTLALADDLFAVSAPPGVSLLARVAEWKGQKSDASG